MSKQLISVDGEDILVREDTAKSFRGVWWALISLAAILAITLGLFLGGVIKLSTDGKSGLNPPHAENDGRR